MTDTAAPPSARPPAFGDLEGELASTRRVLERVPFDRWEWRPHEKSMSLGELALHVAGLPGLAAHLMRSDEYQVFSAQRPEKPADAAGLVAIFDARSKALVEAVDGVTAEGWRQPVSLRNGEQVIVSFPRAAALRVIGISHIIHHRGQLTVYLRLLGVPVPGMYGPSADERGG